MLHNIQAVVFDLDNTLVTSSLNFKLIKRQLGCEPEKDLLDFVAVLPTEQQQQAEQHILTHELEDAHTAKTLEGCHALLTSLELLNLKTAIITRNCKQAASIKIANNKINIPLLLTREDHAAKPAPDALLYLADKWQIDTSNILYVGDYLYDILTAQNANALSCLICHFETPDYANKADILVNSLVELNQALIKAQA